MTLRCLIVLLTLGLCATLARAQAGKERDPLSSGDVVVGIVKAVSADEATNGNPARVTVKITETLKGLLKGTIVVVWQGPSHDVDYGTPATNPIVIRWAAEPAEKPKVGDAYILFGRLSSPMDKNAKESQWFYTRPGGRMPDTPENRKKALEAIKSYDEVFKAERDRQAAAAARHEAAVKQWRAGMTDEKLAAAIKEADFVAIGKAGGVMTPGTTCTFTVTEVFKGRKRKAYADDSYFVQLTMTQEVAGLIDYQPEYLLLLSERGLVLCPSVLEYRPVGDGVVLADAAAITLARESTKGLAGKGPPAVFLCPDDPALADALETVAGGRVTVIRGYGYRFALPWDKISATTGLQADFLVCIERSRGTAKQSIRLELTRTEAAHTPLVDKTLTEPDEKALASEAPGIIAAILKAK